MLKKNDHRPGRGQPVLLISQYCQPLCMSRLTFVSVLHAVPRMFDLERQLLCITLHKNLFRPALEASGYQSFEETDPEPNLTPEGVYQPVPRLVDGRAGG
ncbi:unnamed protein product, partial [Discosporangium mesarthrocarpum]